MSGNLPRPVQAAQDEVAEEGAGDATGQGEAPPVNMNNNKTVNDGAVASTSKQATPPANASKQKAPTVCTTFGGYPFIKSNLGQVAPPIAEPKVTKKISHLEQMSDRFLSTLERMEPSPKKVEEDEIDQQFGSLAKRMRKTLNHEEREDCLDEVTDVVGRFLRAARARQGMGVMGRGHRAPTATVSVPPPDNGMQPPMMFGQGPQQMPQDFNNIQAFGEGPMAPGVVRVENQDFLNL